MTRLHITLMSVHGLQSRWKFSTFIEKTKKKTTSNNNKKKTNIPDVRFICVLPGKYHANQKHCVGCVRFRRISTQCVERVISTTKGIANKSTACSSMFGVKSSCQIRKKPLPTNEVYNVYYVCTSVYGCSSLRSSTIYTNRQAYTRRPIHFANGFFFILLFVAFMHHIHILPIVFGNFPL